MMTTANGSAEPSGVESERGGRVVLVEDEPLVARAVASALSAGGYTVCGLVESGERAPEVVRKQRPDVVVMDIQLNGSLDGIAVAERLRESRYDGPLIYLTAHASNEVVRRASNTSPHAYLLKPLMPRQLLAALQIAIARQEDERKLREELERARAVLSQVCDAARDVLGDPEEEHKGSQELLRRRLEALSVREREVFDLAVHGEPVASLSKTLFISPYTARNHLAAIYRKLGVSSRLELSTTYLPLVRKGD